MELQKCWAFLVITLLLLAAAESDTAESTTIPKQLIELKEDNWHYMLQGEWMVEL